MESYRDVKNDSTEYGKGFRMYLDAGSIEKAMALAGIKV